ncbi:MAG TPA: site-specific integrase [Candidatus Cloacimonas acidaminovorans]|nr:site-specific integrase [Candidatus Cloacimonas acidaminovorans]
MTRYTDVTPYNQIQNFLNECTDPYWKRIAAGLYYTGARAGELIQIQSQHITKENNFLIIKINTEKNKHSPIRYIPINTKTEPDALQIFTITPNPNDLCFPPLKPEIKETSFLRYMRKAFNKQWAGIAPHYFRHCRLTHMVTEFDFNDQELVKYAGWVDSKPAKWYMSLKVTDLQKKMGVQ